MTTLSATHTVLSHQLALIDISGVSRCAWLLKQECRTGRIMPLVVRLQTDLMSSIGIYSGARDYCTNGRQAGSSCFEDYNRSRFLRCDGEQQPQKSVIGWCRWYQGQEVPTLPGEPDYCGVKPIARGQPKPIIGLIVALSALVVLQRLNLSLCFKIL